MEDTTEIKKTVKQKLAEMFVDPSSGKTSLPRFLAVVFAFAQFVLLGFFGHIVYRLLLGDTNPLTTGDSDTLKQLITGMSYNGFFILLLIGVIKFGDVQNLKNTLQNTLKDGNCP